MRALPLLLACAALSACTLASRDVRGEALAAHDLADSTVTVELIAALDEADRPAFRQFLLHHLATSTGFCGEALFDEQGEAPATIGDAIRLTRLREERLARDGLAYDLASLTPQARQAIELDRLNRQRGELNDLIANARMTGNSANVAEHQRRITQLSQRIEQLAARPL
jgi:hypothetical protein